ncbi:MULTISPECIES: MarR family transcriptional regulator [unclassified Amycolatopsis]|uniref:MarR family winged helix-turn-helix transcriptional regulator n=1 Tax=unclassified Amycolatopsis TaxID=2618356 RepID=UPI002876C7F2|nr:MULTISPECIES: MarR family transcriptional regulator [unclassified Amycolatopsis]MDS0140406.1 MarR family transcriptional regulator [Amycolatopsis sp. 505]MDS0148989.1 MarR family transcriptional regulator [Amycolatopsis sp. CM201R]
MNDVPNLARDEDDRLYSPDVRSALAGFTLGEDTGVLEAAAAVRTAARSLEALRSRGTDSRGLSPGALDILIRLATGGAQIKDLAASAGVSSRNVTGLVDTLERAGLAERVPDSRDRRAVQVGITAEGRTWLEEFRRPSQLAMAALFRGFTTAETAQLRHLCLRLAENQYHLTRHLEDR